MSSLPVTPADIPAERALIGSCLLDREAIIAAAWLPDEAFYLERHASIWRALKGCYEQGTPPDLATVASELRRLDETQVATAIQTMTECISETPSAVHVEFYAGAVERAYRARRLIAAGAEVQRIGYGQAMADPDGASDAAEQVVMEATRRANAVGDWVPAAQMVNELFAYLSSPETPALTTGLADLDQRLVGYQSGRLYIAAARPGMGKSGMALTSAAAGCRQGARIGIYSLEMSRLEVLCRIVAEQTNISAQRIQAKQVAGDDLSLVFEASARVHTWPLVVDDISGQHISAIRSKARRAHAAQPFDLLIVDYLQLAEADGDNRVQEVGAVVRGLKNLARELNIPILALAQVNRQVEGRSSKVPMLSDLRESGELEQAADVVLFLHRPEYYEPETERRGIVEIHIAKQRNGPSGVHVDAQFHAPSTLFRNLAPEGYR